MGAEEGAGDRFEFEGPNLSPPGEGFGLWRHGNAGRLGTEGWPGLYWARQTEGGDYEIRAVVGEGAGYSYPAGIFPKEPFEGLYERVEG